MQCVECLSHNDSGAAFCAQCGARLDPGAAPRGTNSLTVLVGLLTVAVLFGGGLAYFISQRDGSRDRESN
ncbi:MAG: hypothetical protein KDC38_20550, partial [Planctomycetes bacterium]|nr:hypothetical protein [Planctomycetota bacterium]